MIAFNAGQQPLRRAALLVHALPEADAHWLLDTLSAHQRSALAPLLEELRALGMPRDRTLVAGLDRAGVRVQPARGRVLDDLDDAGIARLERLLAGEPCAVRSKFLAAGAWPWRARLAPHLGVAAHASEGPNGAGAALRESLLRAVENQLAHKPVSVRSRTARWWVVLRRHLLGARSAP